MKALLIKDELHWRDHWSVELGKHLETRDSSNNLLIFTRGCDEKEIMSILADAPKGLYQIIDLEEAPEEDCDFMADSGVCYRKLH